jgi:hypothetical protein
MATSSGRSTRSKNPPSWPKNPLSWPKNPRSWPKAAPSQQPNPQTHACSPRIPASCFLEARLGDPLPTRTASPQQRPANRDHQRPGRHLRVVQPHRRHPAGHQPARLGRPHPGQLARRTLTSATPTDPAARPPPRAGRNTSRLTAHPADTPPTGTRHIDGCRDSLVRSVRSVHVIAFSATRWADLLGEWFPHLVSTELQHSRFAEIAPYHELIDEMLKTTPPKAPLVPQPLMEVVTAPCERRTHRQARKPRSTTATLASGPTRPAARRARVSSSVRAS